MTPSRIFVWRVCALDHDARRIVNDTFADLAEAEDRKGLLEELSFIAEVWLERAPIGDWERYA